MNSEKFSFCQLFHEKIIEHFKSAEQWFSEKMQDKVIPFYSSFDIRDSNFKIACVDANVFPAGFNNICKEDQQNASRLIQDYLEKHYPSVKKILLLAEEHTRNLYYWDNIFVIKFLIEQAGYKVNVCVPGKEISTSTTITTASGKKVSIQLLKAGSGDLIISNNDFSVSYQLPEDIECIPSVKMGWLNRKKDRFFKKYNSLAKEFAELLKIDPWHLTIQTELFTPFDIESKENLTKLKNTSRTMLKSLKEKQAPFLKDEPYLFLKNNSGTYGMGVMSLNDPESLEQLNWKTRKKMKSSKGEGKVSEIIIQEGIPTALHSLNNQSAEPVVYMLGQQTAGGFLRSHKTKDSKVNLNSPGVVFRRFCMSDLEIKIQGLVMENAYSWIAKLGVVALTDEMAEVELSS